MDYHLQLCYPSDMLEAAEQFDNVIWETLQQATGLNLPKKDEGLGFECPPGVPVDGMADWSFQRWMAMYSPYPQRRLRAEKSCQDQACCIHWRAGTLPSIFHR